MRRLSLRRLAALLFLAVLIASAGTVVGTLTVTRQTIARIVDDRITDQSAAIAESGEAVSTALLIRRIEDAVRRRDTGDIGFQLSDREGRVLAGNVALRRKLPPGFSSLTVSDQIEGLTHGRALVRDIGQGRTLITLAETEPIQGFNSVRVQILLGGFTAVILIVAGGMLLFGRIISQRVTEMRRTVDAIVEGNMDQRVPVDGLGSELDQQAQAFNRMLDRIAALMASISNVSHDIAHDLRSPLARLRTLLALTLREADHPSTRERLGEALAEVDHILALFAAILRIAEVEGGSRRAGFTRFDIAELLAETAALCEPLAEEEGHSLDLQADMPPTWVRGDRRLLAQAVINLLENAIHHTPAGTGITLSMSASPERIGVVVQDRGPGIPTSQHAEALRRFGRLDKSRHRSGNGLGLSLVDVIARLHGGSVKLADAAPGLRVVLTLPVG